MRLLRRISTRRLLTLCAAVLAIAIGTTAVAMATSGDGPKPLPKSLPAAIHEALAAPDVPGISARVQFTNHLIAASSLQGSDPLLSGAVGRLWASPEGKLRLELQSEGGGGDSQVLVDQDHFEIYDGSAETAYRGTLPTHNGAQPKDAGAAKQSAAPSLEEIESELARLGQHLNLSGATPSDVAGQPTYTVQVEPKEDGGLLGGAALAWDAAHGTPLRAAIYAKGDSSPVLQLEATEVSFEAVPASVFEITPPPGTKVINLSPPQQSSSGPNPAPVNGVAAVQAQLGFKLDAPESLAEMSRADVRPIGVGGKTGALVTYGQGLGGLVVLESPSGSGNESASSGSEGLSLPTVSIDAGTTAEELETPLGTALRFSRGGIDFVVAGSVPAAKAEAAARGL